MVQLTNGTAIDLILLICQYSQYHDTKIENMLLEKGIIKENFHHSGQWKEFLENASESTLVRILEYL